MAKYITKGSKHYGTVDDVVDRIEALEAENAMLRARTGSEMIDDSTHDINHRYDAAWPKEARTLAALKKRTAPMTDTPKDLTAPEAVERLIVWLMDAHEMGDTSKNPEVWLTLEALSAQLLDVTKREAAMIARYDAKLDAAEARAQAAEAELEADERFKLRAAKVRAALRAPEGGKP